jgi:hypothetical protein
VSANIDGEMPLSWTGKRFSRAEAVCRFAFSRQYQLRHVDGLTFDFLYGIAEELEGSGELVVIGAGHNGQDPLFLERNGLPYRGFLEGRIKENQAWFKSGYHFLSRQLLDIYSARQ